MPIPEPLRIDTVLDAVGHQVNLDEIRCPASDTHHVPDGTFHPAAP